MWNLFKDAWQRAARQRLTRAGAAFTGLLIGVSLAAFFLAGNLLFLMLGVLLATFVVSGFVSRLGLSGLEIDLVLPEHISARRTVPASIRVRNLKHWMPSFSIHVSGESETGLTSLMYFPILPAGRTMEEQVEVYFPRRGTQKERTFQFSTRFPFGFTDRHELVTARHDVLVYPCLEPQPGFEFLADSVAGEVEAAERGQGHDFYRLRPYEASESARHLDWKATAHTGALQVREFTRQVDRRVLIYLDLNVPFSASQWFEWAVECCAFLAVRLNQRGVEIRFQTQDMDVTLPGELDIYTLLRYLALVVPLGGKPELAPDPASSFFVVFSAFPDRVMEAGWNPGGAAGRIITPEINTGDPL